MEIEFWILHAVMLPSVKVWLPSVAVVQVLQVSYNEVFDYAKL